MDKMPEPDCTCAGAHAEYCGCRKCHPWHEVSPTPTPQPDDFEAEVRGLLANTLPCSYGDLHRCLPNDEGRCLNCEMYFGVLAALRKQDVLQSQLEGVEQMERMNEDGYEKRIANLERQLAEAKAERDALQRRFDGVSIDRDEQLHIAAEVIAANDELRTRLAHLEAALAKVPHLSNNNGFIGRVGGHVEPWPSHDREACAELGGQCALTQALAATGITDANQKETK